MFEYYVYAYLREDGSPYYIGKGKGDRAWSKGKLEVKKPKNVNRIIILENNLSHIGSLAIERRLIRWYGRKDLGTGILRNQTNGGDGGPGAKSGGKLSEKTKKKISLAHIGKKRGPMSEGSKRKLSVSLKGKNKGKPRTDEQKNHQSLIRKGKKRKPHSVETKLKIREKVLGKKVGPMKEEHKNKISKALTGKIRSKEHCKNLSNSLKGRKPGELERKAYLEAMERNKTTCEYCGKTTTKGNYVRWHGLNCKKHK